MPAMTDSPTRRRRWLAACLLAAPLALLAGLVPTAKAQSWPQRPIRLVVPIPPGGTPDLVARLLAEKLLPRLGRPVVVENRAGSNGNIAAEFVARSPADGYTLLLGMDSIIVVNPHLYRQMSFDPLKDLTGVATLTFNRFVLLVNPALPVRNFAEFVEFARNAKQPLAYASGGVGSNHHLTMEMLKARAGINLLHVPFKGGSPAAFATVSGETAVMFAAGASTSQLIAEGRLRGIAVAGRTRAPAFPDLPTIAETYPGFDTTSWTAVFAPAGTPDAVTTRLRAEVGDMLAQPDVKERLHRAGGLEPYPTTAAEFATLVRADNERYRKVVKDLAVSLE